MVIPVYDVGGETRMRVGYAGVCARAGQTAALCSVPPPPPKFPCSSSDVTQADIIGMTSRDGLQQLA